MSIQEQEDLFDLFVREQKDIMMKKGDDYANEDRLSNFKLVAAIARIPVESVLMVFLATKVVRLGNLSQTSRKPNCESKNDNLVDLANYAQLLNMVYTEQADYGDNIE